MAGEKLKYVKNAAQLIPQYLSADDRFSLVTYDQYVNTPLDPQPAIHKDYIRHTIEEITHGWGTNLSAGWLKGCQHVAEGMQAGLVKRIAAPAASRQGEESTPTRGQVNRVFLLTDGIANMGNTDPNYLAAVARQKRDEGIITTTIGVGMDFNEDLLVRMASEGGGEFYFIDSPDQAPHIFSQMLGHVQGMVGQNLAITMTPLQNARLAKQISTYPAVGTAGNVVYYLGDLTRDESKVLLVQLVIPSLETLGQVEIARLRFDYDELGEKEVVHRTLELSVPVNVVPEGDAEGQAPNPEVVKTTLLLRAAHARQEAVEAADHGDFRQASDILRQAADAIEEANLDDDDLQAEHDMLREEAVDMELGEERYDAHVRKVGVTKVSAAFDSHERRMGTQALHERMKRSRQALERNGPTPKLVKWKRESLDLTMNVLRFGRADDNDICISDEEVSRYHCRIVREGDNLYLFDINTRNGTFANGGLVVGRFRLSAGDVISIGAWLFRFEE
jgi:Ca-activated chloride channel family protein